jgi:hypothetical protein
MGRLLPPVMGSLVELEHAGEVTLRLWITGDVLFRPELAAVGERWPDLDAMVIHLGGTRVFGVLVTMDGPQGMQLVETVRPGLTIPVHYDDYGVFKSPLSDFLGEAHRRGGSERIRPVHRGETIELPLRGGDGGKTGNGSARASVGVSTGSPETMDDERPRRPDGRADGGGNAT